MNLHADYESTCLHKTQLLSCGREMLIISTVVHWYHRMQPRRRTPEDGDYNKPQSFAERVVKNQPLSLVFETWSRLYRCQVDTYPSETRVG